MNKPFVMESKEITTENKREEVRAVNYGDRECRRGSA